MKSLEHAVQSYADQFGTPEFHVFISSTFRDMQSEREHLVKHVFPRLRDLCRERGVRFTEIDGITAEQAQKGEGVGMCLDTISSHRPFFICIIGSTYGWVPDPEELERQPEVLERYPWLRHAVAQGHSLLEMEINEGALRNDAMAGRAFFYFRDPSVQCPESSPEADASLEKLEALKSRIRRSTHPLREAFVDPKTLGEWIIADMRAVIDEHFPPDDRTSEFSVERRAHEGFAANRRRSYVERPEPLAALDAHAQGDGPPLVITGESGSGKSALVAYWAARYREARSDAFIIEHYVGAASAATDHAALVRRIMSEIKARYDLPDDIPITAEEIESAFPRWLSYVRDENLVLIIDALDQLDSRSQPLRWLPEYIPSHIRLIVSSLEGESLDCLRERGWPRIHVEPLSLAERNTLVQGFLKRFSKQIDPGQLQRVSHAPTSANPLRLCTSLEELRRSTTYEELNARIGHFLQAQGLDELFQLVLERFESEYGQELVRDVMTLIWASRHGLTERDLRELHDGDPESLARLLPALDYHLMRRSSYLTFFHDHFRRAVEKRYLADVTSRKRAHLRLARYFSTQPMSSRTADELPWQWKEARSWKKLAACISEVELLLALWTEEKRYELLAYWVAINDDELLHASYEGTLVNLTAHPVYGRQRGHIARIIGALFQLAGRYAEAREMLRLAVRLLQREGERGLVQRAESYALLAATYQSLGNFGEAGRNLERARSIYSRLPKDHERELAAVIENLAELQFARHELDAAELNAREALAIRERITGVESREVIMSRSTLAVVLLARGDILAAESMLVPTLRMCRRLLGADHPLTLQCLNNLGVVYQQSESFEAATDMFEKALSGNQKVYGESHPETTAQMVNLGMLLRHRGDLDGAERMYRAVIAYDERTFGARHPRMASTLINLASVLRLQGRADLAEPILRRALAIRRNAFGPRHVETAHCMLNLASLLKERGAYGQAKKYYDASIQVRVAVLGRNHRQSRAAIEGYRDLVKRMAAARRK